MPIRIKPVIDLGPCVLDINSIKGICSLIEENFTYAQFSAEDKFWEVYDEPGESFISTISSHQRLDTFLVKAEKQVAKAENVGGDTVHFTDEVDKHIELVFNSYQAIVKFNGAYNHEYWLEHFIIDLRKHLHPPSFQQRIFARKSQNNHGKLGASTGINGGIIIGIVDSFLASAISSESLPYSKISLYEQPTNALIENIKANLLSNVIWVIIAFVGWFAFGILLFWINKTYGVNISDWFVPPSLPTPTSFQYQFNDLILFSSETLITNI